MNEINIDDAFRIYGERIRHAIQRRLGFGTQEADVDGCVFRGMDQIIQSLDPPPDTHTLVPRLFTVCRKHGSGCDSPQATSRACESSTDYAEQFSIELRPKNCRNDVRVWKTLTQLTTDGLSTYLLMFHVFDVTFEEIQVRVNSITGEYVNPSSHRSRIRRARQRIHPNLFDSRSS